MGDLRVDAGYPNGFMSEDRRWEVVPLWPQLNPDPSSIGVDSWTVAEETIQQMLCCIHPTLDSEEKRKDVIEYVQKLIRTSLGCEVFPYGSVPLKTYLPDGDIDLTALSSHTVEGNLAHNVLALLQAEEQKENSEYEVKDTQFIDAEVKLVKCLVQDIVIDISFNQLGGLCSLCFLEQIDRIVGKDHLFKRSIILIKAWCYYESRILGAHHGLISTYALETLVLYIFHLFHLSLNGPVAVLYRFLDYFSKFDWDNYCISLKGPVPKSSLPDIVVQMPPNSKGNFLLTEEFLRNCLDMFSVPAKGSEADMRTFPLKHLNIIDPLKENNNLGRSVHRGNYYRIRSALKYGARKLGRILLLPAEGIADEMKMFFSNTIERHGSKNANLSSFQSRALSDETTQVNSWSCDLENYLPGMGYNGGVDTYLLGLVSEKTCSVDGSGASGSHLAGEASVNDSSYCSSSSSVGDLSQSLSRLNFYATPYHYSGSSTENGGRLQNGMSSYKENPAANLIDENVGRDLLMERSDKYYLGVDNGGVSYSCISSEYDGGSSYSCCSTISSPYASTLSEGLSLDFRESDIIAGSPETLDPLSELTGDYDSHIRSLLYGQCCNGYALSAAAVLPSPPTFPCQFQKEEPSNETMDHLAPSTCGSNYGAGGKHNRRETADLHLPNANGCSMERSSSNQARASQQQRSSSRNGSSVPPVLSENSHNKGRHYSSQCQAALSTNGVLETNHVAAGSGDSHSRLNGFSVSSSSSKTKLEFGSVGSEECIQQPGLDACCGGQGSSTLTFKKSSRIGSK